MWFFFLVCCFCCRGFFWLLLFRLEEKGFGMGLRKIFLGGSRIFRGFENFRGFWSFLFKKHVLYRGLQSFSRVF